jgi:integrase/recombinase XerD
MRKHCPANERTKRDYFVYLKEAQRYSEPTLDGAAKSIARFEAYTRHMDFKKFHVQQAVGFKQKLASETNLKTGKPLSLATQRATLKNLTAFFKWLAAQQGYKSRFTYADADYFNISEKDDRAAQNSTPRAIPSLEQVLYVIRTMPATTAIDQRDRALVAFTLLTGCRDRALVSLKMKHIDLANRRVNFDAREVKTKFSKSFVTFFMPVGDDISAIFEAWVATLATDFMWGPDDPLFPATKMELDNAGSFRAMGLERKHWTTANAVRRIFKESFEAAGLPYFHPHSLRHTLGHLGLKISRSPEHLKAWSQNYGHEAVLTTLMSYGKVPTQRQGEIMRELASPAPPPQADLIDFVRMLAASGKHGNSP